MGNQKGKHLHTSAKELVKNFPNLFNKVFADNKKKVVEMDLLTECPRERNQLAGCITKLVQSLHPKESQ